MLRHPLPMLVQALLFTCLLPAGIMAQVPEGGSFIANGGFEKIRKEPKTFDQLDRAEAWEQVTIGFPDLFSPEASEKTVGIPDNFYGHAEPAEGKHYAGFVAWKDDQRRDYDGDPQDPFKPGWSSYSEYLRTPLASPLQEGHHYRVSFQVALAGNSDRAIAGIGALATPFKLHYQNRKFLKERPQVVEEKILEARGEWVTVTGDFVADGGEKYLIIGTFPTAIFETKRIIDGLDNKYAYYYIDNVEFKELPLPEKGQ